MERTDVGQDRWSVRPPSSEEVQLLASREPGGDAGIAESHYRAYVAGRIDYGVAWRDCTPCGEVVLDLSSVGHGPELKHLFVFPGLRGRGIGRDLVNWAECAARSRGYDQIILRVGVDNPGARELYLRLGYTATGRIEVTRYEYPGDDGELIPAEESDEIFIKAL